MESIESLEKRKEIKSYKKILIKDGPHLMHYCFKDGEKIDVLIDE